MELHWSNPFRMLEGVMMISSAALSSIGDNAFSSPVGPKACARSTIASKHAMEARANAISDVCC